MQGRVVGSIALIAGLASCATPQPLTPVELAQLDRRDALLGCCTEPGVGLSEGTILALEQAVPMVKLAARKTKFRESYLQTATDAQDAIVARARPLDVLIARNGSRLSGSAGVGFFGHAQIYTGSEAELRSLGVWDHPAVAPHHAEIRAGAIGIEATEIGVHLSDRAKLFEVDTVALFRPRTLDRAARRRGVIRAFRMIGRPFDLDFDSSDPARVSCTELVEMAVPELGLPVQRFLARDVTVPDAVAAHALAGRVPMDLLVFIQGYPVGWRLRDEDDMAALILGAWPR